MKRTYRYRSAVTGRFVKAAYAKRYPKRTLREALKQSRLDKCRIVDLLDVALSRGCESLPADLLRQIEGYGMAADRACEVYAAIRANRGG